MRLQSDVCDLPSAQTVKVQSITIKAPGDGMLLSPRLPFAHAVWTRPVHHRQCVLAATVYAAGSGPATVKIYKNVPGGAMDFE